MALILLLTKVTVTPDRAISGSYDWFRLGQDATDRQCLLRSNRAYRDRSLLVVALSRTMARAFVGNRATSGSDQRPM